MQNLVTVTILAGTSVSDAFRFLNYEKLAIQLPAAWTAASISFLGCAENGGTYGPVFQDFPSAEVTLTAAAGRAISIEAYLETLRNFPYLKIQSGTSVTPVNQAADRSLIIFLS